MNLNIPLFILSILIVIISVRLNGIIKENSACLNSDTLKNVNSAIFVVGILLFIVSVGIKNENPIYSLILGIIVIVLFSLASSILNKCKVSLSSFDSTMILCVFIGSIVMSILSGKKIYDNRLSIGLPRESSPNRQSYVDPFGLDLPRESSPNRQSYVDPFGLDLPRESSPNRQSYVDPFGLDLPRESSPNRQSYVDPFGLDF